MSQSGWEELVLDTAAVPLPLSEERFKQWASAQRIFVSSLMDTEMAPYREAIRDYLQHLGSGVPIMWETLSPQDISSKQAYLSGVDRSSIFLLMLGSRYGIPDDSGYSPTHQEANRATVKHLQRLLFTLPVPRKDRDGKLNDWLGGLYTDVSGNAAGDPAAVVKSLDGRLRDFAARSERLWLKLGRFIFTGRVETSTDRQGARTFKVIAKAFDPAVRQGLLTLNDPYARRGGELRLTWPNESFPVSIESVAQKQQFASETDVEICCRTPSNWYGNTGSDQMIGSVNGVSTAELTRRWLQQVIFGEPVVEDARMSGFGFITRPDGPTLPQVLKASGAMGWQAEGITALYMIEEAARKRGAKVRMLRAGPATSKGVPLLGQLSVEEGGQSSAPILIEGLVPLST